MYTVLFSWVKIIFIFFTVLSNIVFNLFHISFCAVVDYIQTLDVDCDFRIQLLTIMCTQLKGPLSQIM